LRDVETLQGTQARAENFAGFSRVFHRTALHVEGLERGQPCEVGNRGGKFEGFVLAVGPEGRGVETQVFQVRWH